MDITRCKDDLFNKIEFETKEFYVITKFYNNDIKCEEKRGKVQRTPNKYIIRVILGTLNLFEIHILKELITETFYMISYDSVIDAYLSKLHLYLKLSHVIILHKIYPLRFNDTDNLLDKSSTLYKFLRNK
jgi:hypothetical protein